MIMSLKPRGPKQYCLQLAIHIYSFTDWLVLRKLKKKKKLLVVYSSVSDMLLKMNAEAKSRGNTVIWAVVRPNGQLREAGVARGVRGYAPPEKF